MSNNAELKAFLNEFVHGYLSKPDEEKLPPFRLVEDKIHYEEIKGHCCGWAADYLFAHKCPALLSNLVCCKVVEQVGATDLSEMLNSSSSDEGDVYDANKLCQLTFRLVEEIITCWTDELPSHVIDCCSSFKHQISCFAIKNTRRKMEDRHNTFPLLKLFTDNEAFKETSLYTVFDGHGGPDASSYAAAHFPFYLLNQSTEDWAATLSAAFAQIDVNFSVRAAKEKLHSGTTGVAVLIEPNHLAVAWLGDSQALLVKSGRATEIMNPHKPECEEERARIEALGGSVVFFGTWRVNGNLAVSRAIGDIDYKPYISSDADSRNLPLDGSEEYIIVACDGLWDTVTFDEAVQLVYNHIQSGKAHKDVAEVLVRAAREEGSSDNITVTVVFLKSDLSVPVPTEHPPCDTPELSDSSEEDESETIDDHESEIIDDQSKSNSTKD
ncbi:protein phosphatase 1E-like isoform X2 [Watersipora subatra]|uniref:protein phosphatase 1E-like isoform X2 n=1 Tax=Watersipora subatra TaxID=2589382 RepID=UPI00355AED6C